MILFSLDAYLGLKDLLTLHPRLLTTDLGTLLTKLVDGIIDEDRPVRQACHTCMLLVSTHVTETRMLPFVKLCITYVCLGMSQAQPAIRRDAVGFLMVT